MEVPEKISKFKVIHLYNEKIDFLVLENMYLSITSLNEVSDLSYITFLVKLLIKRPNVPI